MIRLTKINGEEVLVNINKIQMIESIPESRVVFDNKEFLIVTEKPDVIIDRIIDFNAKIYASHRTLLVEKKD